MRAARIQGRGHGGLRLGWAGEGRLQEGGHLHGSGGSESEGRRAECAQASERQAAEAGGHEAGATIGERLQELPQSPFRNAARGMGPPQLGSLQHIPGVTPVPLLEGATGGCGVSSAFLRGLPRLPLTMAFRHGDCLQGSCDELTHIPITQSLCACRHDMLQHPNNPFLSVVHTNQLPLLSPSSPTLRDKPVVALTLASFSTVSPREGLLCSCKKWFLT